MVGYDYTFFDKNYLELDGGIYDDPDISIWDFAGGRLFTKGCGSDWLWGIEKLYKASKGTSKIKLVRTVIGTVKRIIKGSI